MGIDVGGGRRLSIMNALDMAWWNGNLIDTPRNAYKWNICGAKMQQMSLDLELG
jgi:hypothetical protein